MSEHEDRKCTGLVFNIQHYSVHDGPGIRSNVFLKGCPLSCLWCSNPESQRIQPDVAFKESRCLTLGKCERCLKACPKGAIDRGEGGLPVLRRELCGDCSFECAEACPPRSLIVYGTSMRVDEVLEQVEKQSVFFNRSEGGMTLSGGEPLFQTDFAVSLLREARRRRLQTTVETTGCLAWEKLQEAARHLTTIIYDLKHSDSARHKAGTGVENGLILDNFHKLAAAFPKTPVLVRTPVIPGFNDDAAVIAALVEHVAPYPNVTYELLPYHRLGTQKYLFIGRECTMGEATLPPETMRDLHFFMQERLGARAVVPSARKR